MAKSLKVHITIAIALLISFAILVGNINISYAFAETFEVSGEAQSEKQWTSDEVSSLEQLREVPVEQIASWSQYDSRDYGIVTPVKNQGAYNLCWVYAPLSAMETSLLRKGIEYPSYADTPDLSPLAFAMATKGWFDDPLDLCDEDNTTDFGSALTQSDWDVGGLASIVGLVASKWYGLYQLGDDYDNAFKADQKSAKEQYSPVRLENTMTCNNNVTAIKELVATYGSATFSYSVNGMDAYSEYFKAAGSRNHMSVIVGWDDNVSVQEFASAGFTVSKPGAWIVKNSWGTGYHNAGYYYLSYESSILQITAFDMMGEDDYDYNYNYAGAAPPSGDYQYRDSAYGNKFMAAYEGQKGVDGSVEYLKGVNVGIYGNNVTADIRIYTNVDTNKLATFNPESATPAITTSKSFKYQGIYTIELPSKVEIKAGEYYLIYVELKSGIAPYGIIHEMNAAKLSSNDLTFCCAAWTYQWTNFKDDAYIGRNSVALIRGLTVVEDNNRQSIADCSVTLEETTFTYNGSAHKPIPTVKLNNTTLFADQDYTVFYKDNINAGQATIEIVGMGEYWGTVIAHFTIGKAERQGFSVSLAGWTYGEIANTPVVSFLENEKGEVNFTYSKNHDSGFTDIKPKDAGTYYVKAVVEQTANYTSAEAIAEFRIQKADKPSFDGELSIEVDSTVTALKQITLPAPWKWQDGDKSITDGMTAIAEYDGVDKANYINTQVAIVITVKSDSEPDPKPEHQHELTRIEARLATCTENGNTAYYTCNGCDSWFEDADGETEIINHNSVVIPAAHDYTGVDWSWDEIGHWLECTACGEHTQKVEHDSDGENRTCSDCGYRAVYTEPQPEPDPTPGPDDNNPNDTDKTTDEDGNKVAVAVGVTTGVVGAGAAGGGVAFWLIRRRRRL